MRLEKPQVLLYKISAQMEVGRGIPDLPEAQAAWGLERRDLWFAQCGWR